MHLLLDKKLIHFYVPGYGPDWLAVILVYLSVNLISKIWELFPQRTISVTVLRGRIFLNIVGLTQFYLSPLHCLQIVRNHPEMVVLDLFTWCQVAQQVSFLNFWISEGCSFSHIQCPTDSRFLHVRQNPETKCMQEYVHKLIYIYIYIYIYIRTHTCIYIYIYAFNKYI